MMLTEINKLLESPDLSEKLKKELMERKRKIENNEDILKRT